MIVRVIIELYLVVFIVKIGRSALFNGIPINWKTFERTAQSWIKVKNWTEQRMDNRVVDVFYHLIKSRKSPDESFIEIFV